MASDCRCKVSIVIPVYGSENVLPELVRQIREMADGQADILGDYEIVLVCDRSPDNSWAVIRSLSREHPQIRGILLRMNAGQHNALMAGFAHTRGEIIVTMDDDLQHSPYDIPLLISQIRQGYDVAYARFGKRKHTLWKVAGSRLNDIAARFLIQKPRNLYLSPFRAMKVVIRDDILGYRGPYVYIDGLILSATRNIASVDVEHHERFAGESGYSFKRLVSLWLKMATSFSLFPLRITSILGICFSGLGFFLAFLFILQKLVLDRMPNGWSWLIVSILIFGGVQLLALGMLGEYLGRVLLTINSRRQYSVSETVGYGTCDNQDTITNH